MLYLNFYVLTDVQNGGKVYHICRKNDHFRRENSITMTNKPILALVVSSSGTLQNGLLALITTIPSISAVLVAEDVKSTLRMVENHQPALVILDMSSLEVQDVINEIKNQWPHISVIVLAEDITQQKVAETSGADSVLLKGFPAHKLITIVETVFDRREDTLLFQENTEGGTNAD